MSSPPNPADHDDFCSFLAAGRDRGMALAAESDLLDLIAEPGDAPQRFIARYRCDGLVHEPDNSVARADHFAIGIRFPVGYLDDKPDPARILTVLDPLNIFQSNIRGTLVCLTNLRAGTDLVSILHQLYELITWQSYALHDALNRRASQWARNNSAQLPVDARPLKWRADAEKGGSS